MIDNYERVKGELGEISEAIKLFPEQLQEKVFDTLIAELTDKRSLYSEEKPQSENIVDSPHRVEQVQEKETNLVSSNKDVKDQLFDFFKKNSVCIDGLSDISFTAVVAFFYKELAEKEDRVPEIDREILIDAYELAERKPPKNPGDTLNNAKRKNYLKSGNGKGLFTLTPNGRFHANNEVLSEFKNNQ